MLYCGGENRLITFRYYVAHCVHWCVHCIYVVSEMRKGTITDLIDIYHMITLFLKTGCPFSAKVLAVVDAYQIPFAEKNIGDDGVWEELVALGGKHQVPFMVDGDIMMYDSGAINEYLEKKFKTEGEEVVVKPHVHFGAETSA
jgi:glutaredoxin